MSEMKLTKRQLKLIGYCLETEYTNVESDSDYRWHIWSHLGYGDRDEAPNRREIELKDKQALAELQEVIDIINYLHATSGERMEEE